MSLLHLDASARPSSAAEVMSRLTAIADLPLQAELEVAQAYLTTPQLIGRERHQAEFRDLLTDAGHGQGSALLVSARGGLGRSRLLGSYLLEAKLSGFTVLHVQAGQLPEHELGVIRALLEGLHALGIDPDAAESPAFAVLARFLQINRTAERNSMPPVTPGDDTYAAVRQIVAPWLAELARRTPLAILVDDVHRADPASFAVLVELSGQAARLPMVIVTSVDSELQTRSSQALAALRECTRQVAIEPLDAAQVEHLYESLFGDVPRLKPLADWAQRVAGGNPRTCMELAQHLVDAKIVGLQGGAWVLPEDLAALELPAGVEQVLDRRIAALGATAREFIELISLCTRFLPLQTSDYTLMLGKEHSSQAVFAAIDELVSSNMIVPNAVGYALQHEGLSLAVQRSMNDARRRAMHRKIGEHNATHHRQWALITAHHMFQAGELARGYAHVIADFTPSRELSTPNVMMARAPEGVALFDALLDYVADGALPPSGIHKIRAVALKLGAIADPRLARGADQTLAQLVKDSGRIYFDDTDPTLEWPQRVKVCFERAQAAYDAAPEHARGLAPLAAISELAVCVSTLSAVCGRTRDAARAASLPGLIEPFRVFQAVQVVHDISSMVASSVVHGQNVLEQRKRTLASLEQPVPGIDEVTRLAARMIIGYYAAIDEAVRGDHSALERASALEQHATYAALAWQVRALYYAGAGQAAELMRARKRRALLSMTTSETDHHLIVGVAYELPVLVHTDDLMALHAVLPRLRSDAETYPGWRPLYEYAEASYRALLGQHEKACERFERGLALVQPGKHMAWTHLVEGHLLSLLALGQHERAVTLAREAERALRTQAFTPLEPTHFAAALALCEAHAGEIAGARQRLLAHVEQVENTSRRGIVRGALYEALARVALLGGDLDGWRRFTEKTGNEYRSGAHAGLLGRYERLLIAGSRRSLPPAFATPLAEAASVDTSDTTQVGANNSLELLHTRLRGCSDAPARLRAALALAAELSGAAGAYLYVVEPSGVHLRATHGTHEPLDELGTSVATHVKSVVCTAQDDDESTRAIDEATQSGVVHQCTDGMRYVVYALPSGESEPSAWRSALVLSVIADRVPALPWSFLCALGSALPGYDRAS
jgi:tetratricopeptide (TPR) repeat protein